jgi:hypothetical protein
MTVDDQTAVYILATRTAFEDLRQVVSLLAGVLVLAAAKAKSDSPDLQPARRLLHQAEDALRESPLTAQAAAHHGHLLHAAAHLSIALQQASVRIDIDAILPPLRSGYDALQRASQTLPGFEMVAFEQGCCSMLQEIKT